MGEKKEYRSAVRSRKLIRQAFMEILREKSFEKITVTDIVKKADINRSTFYAHYPDVMGLIDEIQEELLGYSNEFLEKVDFSDFFRNPKPVLKNIINMTEENQELYRLLSNSNMAAQQVERLKHDLINRILQGVDVPEKYKDSLKFEFVIRFFIGGVIDVYTQWLNGEIDSTLEALTDELARMIVYVSDDFQ